MIEIIAYISALYFIPIPLVSIVAHLMAIREKLNSLLVPVTIYSFLFIIIGYFTYQYIQIIFSWKFNNFILKIIGIIIIILALIIEYKTRKNLGFSRIFGSSEIKNTKEKLIISGLYRFARHPRYVEHPLLFLGFGMILGYYSLVIFSIYLFISFVIASYFEEKELINRYGKEYLEYKKKTPAFFLRI